MKHNIFLRNLIDIWKVILYLSITSRIATYLSLASWWLSWSHHFESFYTVAIMTWLQLIVQYLCPRWPWICSILS